jgi:DNA-binding MarR family transcriptional regulator
MQSDEGVGPLDQSVGYTIKVAATALRGAMDAVLRPLGLTVPQYACLELLGQRPGLSNADLARGAFVTRQAMNGVLRGLQDRGLVARPELAAGGRARPAELTASGRRQLAAASRAVRAVELRMLASLDLARQHRLQSDLATCAAALANPGTGIAPR